MKQNNKLKEFKIVVPMSWNEVFHIDARDINHAREILDVSIGYNDVESKDYQDWIAEGMHDNWGDASAEFENITITEITRGAND